MYSRVDIHSSIRSHDAEGPLWIPKMRRATSGLGWVLRLFSKGPSSLSLAAKSSQRLDDRLSSAPLDARRDRTGLWRMNRIGSIQINA